MSQKTRTFPSQLLFASLAAMLAASLSAASTMPAIYSTILNMSNNEIDITARLASRQRWPSPILACRWCPSRTVAPWRSCLPVSLLGHIL